MNLLRLLRHSYSVTKLLDHHMPMVLKFLLNVGGMQPQMLEKMRYPSPPLISCHSNPIIEDNLKAGYERLMWVGMWVGIKKAPEGACLLA